jgi:3-deoxy-D-manno-octulosonic-acid transferase
MGGKLIANVWAGATTVASPGLRLLLLWRARRGKEIVARLRERRGIDETPRPPGRLLWLHAASVGETVSVLPLLSGLAADTANVSILLTTGTVTSARLLETRLVEMDLSRRVLHRFVPLDVPAWVGRFLDHWRPDAAAFIESEIWPNILRACRTRGVPLMLFNARMSERSVRAWSRAPLTARFVLNHFAVIQARSEEDADRLRALGADRVEVTGDLKRSAEVLPADSAQFRELSALLGGRPLLLAASTHPGEESLIVSVHDALRGRHAGLLTIIVPRHPERGAELGTSLRAPRRQAGQGPPEAGIWIADTLGELGIWYRLADVCVIGRSLLPPGGGQNPIEPARLGCAIAVGPFTSNFTAAIDALRERDAVRIVADARELTEFADAMLTDRESRARMGERARLTMSQSDQPLVQAKVRLLELLDR